MIPNTLFELYKKSCKETKNPCENILHDLSEEKAKEYIKHYFDNRGKCEAFEFDYLDNESKILNKAIHTFSTFLLGFTLKDIVHDTLKQYIGKKNSTWKDWDFEYTWFLTSLYHDCLAGYEKVIQRHNGKNSIEKCSIVDFLKRINSRYEYSIYDKNLNNNILKKDKDSVPALESTFPEEVINNYFEYRIKEMNSIDHGIIGGYIQFDKLINNFKELYDSASYNGEIEDGVFYSTHNDKTLVWRIQHLWHFAFVADAILAHNIWFVDLGDEKLVENYRKYGLSSLIVCKSEDCIDNRITLEKSPLLFFLAIIDTIEPTKYFNTLNPKFVLQKISIIYIQEEKTIEITADKKIFNIELWYRKKIKDLKTWINIKDTELDNNKIKIVLN